MKICTRCGEANERVGWGCDACGFEPRYVGGVREVVADSSDGFEESFFDLLAAGEPGHWWFESRNSIILWAMRRFGVEPQNYMEIGCGTGWVLQAVAKAHPKIRLVATEFFAEGFRHVEQRVPQAELVRMDARTIPYRDEFDAIGMFDVIEHIADDETVLQHIFNALEPGGLLLLTVPQHQWLWTHYDTLAHHERRYSRKVLVERVERAGFTIVHTTSFVSLLLPLMVVQRFLVGLKRKEDYQVDGELNVGKTINAILGSIMNFEQAIIRLGFSFPAGGSLLMVARKN